MGETSEWPEDAQIWLKAGGTACSAALKSDPLGQFCLLASECPGSHSTEEPLKGYRWLNENDGVGRDLCLEPDPETLKSKTRLLALASNHKQ